jgi:hypothetical protein
LVLAEARYFLLTFKNTVVCLAQVGRDFKGMSVNFYHTAWCHTVLFAVTAMRTSNLNEVSSFSDANILNKITTVRTGTDFECKKERNGYTNDSIYFLNYNIPKSSNKLPTYHLLPVQKIS